MHGKAVALAALMLTASLGSVATMSFGGGEDPHEPILIVGDDALRNNTCLCIRNPGATGGPSDPFIISDWRIQTDTEPAIEIREIDEEHFVLRDNTLEAKIGVRLVNTGDRGSIVRNTITYGQTGIDLENSTTFVADNVIGTQPDTNFWGTQIGVDMVGGSPHLEGNTVSRSDIGVRASSSSPTILENTLVNNRDAVLLTDSADGDIEANVIKLAQRWGLIVRRSAKADLVGNEIREGKGGVIVEDATLYMASNKVFNQRKEAVRFTDSAVTMFRNNITDNWRGAFGSKDSDVMMVQNTFRNNQNSGIYLLRSEGTVEDNRVRNNGMGIRLDDSIITLEDNVLTNNTIGLSIPYSAKGSIPLMSGNVVNGINVDGTINPSEKRIFLRAFGTQFQDHHFQAGHDDGFSGSLFAQGSLVFYDSVNITIEDSRFTFVKRGITVHNSSFVRVEGSAFFNTHEGVVSVDSRTFIKNVTCEIEIDPQGSVCFDVQGGIANVRNSTAVNVDFGIRFGVHAGVAAKGEITNNTIRATVQAGLHLTGTSDQPKPAVNASGNLIIDGNDIGAVLVNFHGTLHANLIANSTWAAVHLKAQANATFIQNEIRANAKGVVDVGECRHPWSRACAGGVFINNEIRANAGVGVEIDGGASFRGDIVVDNEVGVDLDGPSHMTDVRVEGNAKVGIVATARLGLEDVNVTANGGIGIDVTGHLRAEDTNASENENDGFRVEGTAHLRGAVALSNGDDGIEIRGAAEIHDTNTSVNTEAGMRLTGTLFLVLDCEASFNHDGVIASTGTDVNVDVHLDIQVPDTPDRRDEQDPLFMHECNIVGNEEFALRATVETFVNATANFWGSEGPVYDLPLFRTGNVISDNVLLVTPYWQDRQHTELGCVPHTEAGATQSVPSDCRPV